jgi:hypothetical protein
VAFSRCYAAAGMRLVVQCMLSRAAAAPLAWLLSIALIQAYVQRCVGATAMDMGRKPVQGVRGGSLAGQARYCFLCMGAMGVCGQPSAPPRT